MSSLNSIQTRQGLASGKVVQRADDGSVALRVRYTGTVGTPSVVMTTATKVAMTDATATVDYAWATYSTLGALADALNGSGLWEAKILDGLRADLTTNTFKSNTTIAPTTDDNGVQCWDFAHDNNIVTNASKFVATVCLSPFANFNAPKGHRVHAQELSYYQNVNTATAASVLLYRRLGNATEKLIYSATSVDATITTVSWASGQGKITGNVDEELVFRVTDDSSITDDAANYVRIVGILE
jgi:hypothetical protein